MNIKLRLLSIWTPKFILKRELKRTSHLTIEYLDQLLKQNGIPLSQEEPIKGNLEEIRAHMGSIHDQRVASLIKILGREKAIEQGKPKMYAAGLKLGHEARELLNIESIEDAFAAAKILYKVLGIEFNIKYEQKNIILYINSCALAEQYSAETCIIMSSADKGILKGLNEGLDMEFIDRITTGAEKCKACINNSGQKK